MGTYAVDFETTTDLNDCRVWVWGSVDIESEIFQWGTSVDDFMNHLSIGKSNTAYFHNLQFDGEFLLYWFFRNGYTHTQSRKVYEGEFSTLISDTGQFYTIQTVINGCKIKFVDSYKIIPFSVKAIAPMFGLEESKGEIDYHKYREIGYIPDENELEYLKSDCIIISKALKILFNRGLTKITQGSNAINDLKCKIGKKKFDKWFPQVPQQIDEFIRKAYKGGYVYLKPELAGKVIYNGSQFDVNSLYPFVMRYRLMPFGDAVFFKGKYKNDKIYPLYVQRLKCQFSIKPGFLPTIQIKGSRFIETEYLTDSGTDEVTLTLTNIDLQLFFEHYNIYNIEWLDGYKFMGAYNMFSVYIEYWMGEKIRAEKEGNYSMRTLAKLMLNAAYGKFATNPIKISKIPYYERENDFVRFRLSFPETTKGLYIPVGCFITSYAREVTIRAGQKNFDRFIYSDTDSLKLTGTEKPDIEIHKNKLGAWKDEGNFYKGKWIRAKTYITWEEVEPEHVEKLVESGENVIEDGKTYVQKVTCAGMGKHARNDINFDDFNIGMILPNGKRNRKRVPGGVVLTDIDYVMRNK